jgi:hypothetical protein
LFSTEALAPMLNRAGFGVTGQRQDDGIARMLAEAG